MKTLIILIALGTAALAQGLPPRFTVDPNWAFDNNSELGKAMDACRKHWRSTATQAPRGKRIVFYDPEWSSCETIHAEWLKSPDAAKKETEDAADAAAKSAVDALAKKLGGQK